MGHAPNDTRDLGRREKGWTMSHVRHNMAMKRRVILVAVAAILMGSSCTAGSDGAASEAAPNDTEITEELVDNTKIGNPNQQIDEPPVTVGDSAGVGPGGLEDGEQAILDELQAEGFCDPADVEDGGVVTAMHFVVRGQLQPPCSGELDPRLDAAWTALADVTPVTLLSDISLLAGFEGCDTCDTLAFVTTLDEAAEFFLMAVDVQAGVEDLNELALTMLHELTHVFTQVPATQLDIAIPAQECTTYYNGTGCFRDGAYTWEWIQRFWDAAALATIPADGDVNEEAGEARCVADASYAGPYGASSPEEDIAEMFAAYVFDVKVSTSLDEKLAFFDQYPEFREVRERAEALGRHEVAYSFENC